MPCATTRGRVGIAHVCGSIHADAHDAEISRSTQWGRLDTMGGEISCCFFRCEHESLYIEIADSMRVTVWAHAHACDCKIQK